MNINELHVPIITKVGVSFINTLYKRFVFFLANFKIALKQKVKQTEMNKIDSIWWSHVFLDILKTWKSQFKFKTGTAGTQAMWRHRLGLDEIVQAVLICYATISLLLFLRRVNDCIQGWLHRWTLLLTSPFQLTKRTRQSSILWSLSISFPTFVISSKTNTPSHIPVTFHRPTEVALYKDQHCDSKSHEATCTGFTGCALFTKLKYYPVFNMSKHIQTFEASF